MEEKDPTNWSYGIWLLAFGMSAAGGLINWWNRMRQTSPYKFKIMELIGEVCTSSFVGLGVFMATQATGQQLGICAALAGLSGHMATRFIFRVEAIVEKNLELLAERTDKPMEIETKEKS